MLTLNTGLHLSRYLYLILSYLVFIGFSGFFNAWVGKTVGDYTSDHEDKLTLNPLAHFDLFGFICLVLIGIGWSKRLPINFDVIEAPLRKTKIVFALSAEIIFSLVMGVIFAIFYSALLPYHTSSLAIVLLTLTANISIFFMFFAVICLIANAIQLMIWAILPHSYRYASLLSQMSPLIVLLLVIQYGHHIQYACIQGINALCLIVNQFLTPFLTA